MIRIDEIYENTFWPWLKANRPGYRLFFCDPFGSTDPKDLYNYGRDDIAESNFVFMHDQEPVQLEAHKDLFFAAWDNGIADIKPQPKGHIVVSEKGDMVDRLVDIYGWKSHYYFFHGWACLDWFRGYNQTFLFPHFKDRAAPTHTFMSPNRIMGGERDHRTLFVYHLASRGLLHNHVSAPSVCPYEKVSVTQIANKYINTYPNIVQVLEQAGLPRLFAGEDTQQMTSCWLGNFQEAMSSLVYVPTETVYFGRRTHVTEKTFKAIALGMPWISVASAGTLEYMKSYGFQTFDSVWDESYDQETDDLHRLEMVADLLAGLDSMSVDQKRDVQEACRTIVEHNWNHFYHGGFEKILWAELLAMLESIHD